MIVRSIHQREVSPGTQVVPSPLVARLQAIISFAVAVINTLLGIRLLFLLLGARAVGFAAWLYNVTEPLAAPFRGIFPAPAVETGYFDTASLVAIVVYGLAAWVINSLLEIGSPEDRV